MENKKTIKINLSTVILVFIIFILLFVILGMWYYYNNKKDGSNNIVLPNTKFNITSNSVNTVNSPENSIEFKLGTYQIQFNEDLLGEEFKSSGNEIKGCNYEISFYENNKFSINLGFGHRATGFYAISDNIITCNIDTVEGEYGPSQRTKASISFKINSNSEIEIINASESYEIKVVDIPNNSLTDEFKDMSLWPLVKGIKYVLSK